jgi:hypothetical protein
LSVAGLVPYVGDAVAIPGKVVRFLLRFPRRLDDAIRLVARYDRISDAVKTLALRAILLGDYDVLLRAGFTDATILRFARGERTALQRIAQAVQHSLHIPGDIIQQALRSGRAGEEYLVNVLMAGRQGIAHPPRILTPGIPRPGSYRVIDFLEQLPDGRTVAHEVKTGVPRYGDELNQCARDRFLRESGQVSDVWWHFMPNSDPRYNSIGPDQELLDCLIAAGIRFTIHPPA